MDDGDLIFQDDFDAALLVLDDSYATARRLGYRWGAAMYWMSLARIAKLQGRLEESVQLLERMVAASESPLRMMNEIRPRSRTTTHLALNTSVSRLGWPAGVAICYLRWRKV